MHGGPSADVDSVIKNGARRFSRQWYGKLFFGCWGGLILEKLALDAFSWQQRGLLYSLVFWPLIVGFVAAGIPWLVLVSRDIYLSPRDVWNEARPRLRGPLIVVALMFAIVTAVIAWKAITG